MTTALWQWDELVAAAQGRADGTPAAAITGVSIDSRTLKPGDLFVALGAERDGHDFVGAAFAAGAAAALVARDYRRGKGDGALVRAGEPLAALEAVGRAARARSRARIVAVTGSAGKTGTKEMLRLCLSDAGPTHASEKSYNNHWGVPLTLARMPQTAQSGVFEIGMNHAGEITPLTQMVRPHAVVITTVEPVHLQYFRSVEDIAEAKAEILQGLVPGGSAVLPHDNAHFALLRERAAAVGANVTSFGYGEADVRCLRANMDARGSSVIAGIGSRRFPYRIGAPGEHYVKNSLAVLAALTALGADAMRCLPALVKVAAPAGRGARTLLEAPDGGRILLIDESYNANPASVRAALAAVGTVPRADFPRRVAVLGDMLELGEASAGLHRGLGEAIGAAGIDLVLACGPMMKLPFDRLAAVQQGAWAEEASGLVQPLLDAVRAGDAVMIKGSLATGMAPLVEAMKARFSGSARAGGVG